LSPKANKKVRVGYKHGSIKSIASVTQQSTDVKAVVTVKQTVVDFWTEIGIERGLDDFTDLFGKTLLLELVSAELDPSKQCFLKDLCSKYFIFLFSLQVQETTF
jgi:lipoxygenase